MSYGAKAAPIREALRSGSSWRESYIEVILVISPSASSSSAVMPASESARGLAVHSKPPPSGPPTTWRSLLERPYGTSDPAEVGGRLDPADYLRAH